MEETAVAGKSWDVVVVGAGNAASARRWRRARTALACSCSSARRRSERGGNSRFTAGAMRCVYNGVDDLRRIMPDLTEDEDDDTDFGTYTADQFFDDMGRITKYRTDPDLCDCLVARSSATRCAGCARRACASSRSTAARPSRSTASSSSGAASTVEAWGGGPGLVDAALKAAQKQGIAIVYETPRAVG